MIANDYAAEAARRLGSRCPEPVECALLVHRGPETGGRGLSRLFGKKTVASSLRTNNLLVLTPSHVRLYALGGRSGLVPKDELGAWPRTELEITSRTEERHTDFLHTGSSMDQEVHCLHLTGPDLDLTVDVMANAGLDTGDADLLDPAALAAEFDPGRREVMAGLQAIGAETTRSVQALVAATGG